MPKTNTKIPIIFHQGSLPANSFKFRIFLPSPTPKKAPAVPRINSRKCFRLNVKLPIVNRTFSIFCSCFSMFTSSFSILCSVRSVFFSSFSRELSLVRISWTLWSKDGGLLLFLGICGGRWFWFLYVSKLSPP